MSSWNMFKLAPAKRKVTRTQLLLIVLFLALLALTLLSVIPKVQKLDDLEIVMGVYKNSKQAFGRGSWFGDTYVTVDDQTYRLIGRYDVDSAISPDQRVRLFVSGNQIWAMQSTTQILVSYDVSRDKLQKRRWFFRSVGYTLFFIAALGTIRITRGDHL